MLLLTVIFASPVELPEAIGGEVRFVCQTGSVEGAWMLVSSHESYLSTRSVKRAHLIPYGARKGPIFKASSASELRGRHEEWSWPVKGHNELRHSPEAKGGAIE